MSDCTSSLFLDQLICGHTVVRALDFHSRYSSFKSFLLSFSILYGSIGSTLVKITQLCEWSLGCRPWWISVWG